MSKNNNWVQENKSLLIKGGLIIGSGAFLFYILKATGVIQSSAAKKAEAEKQKKITENATSTNSPFNPNFYKNKPGAALITKAQALAYAEQIYDAVGLFNDNEAAIYAVFRQLKSKTQVSWLAANFYAEYGQDLYAFLADYLNDNELNTVNQIVNGMAEK